MNVPGAKQNSTDGPGKEATAQNHRNVGASVQRTCTPISPFAGEGQARVAHNVAWPAP